VPQNDLAVAVRRNSSNMGYVPQEFSKSSSTSHRIMIVWDNVHRQVTGNEGRLGGSTVYLYLVFRGKWKHCWAKNLLQTGSTKDSHTTLAHTVYWEIIGDISIWRMTLESPNHQIKTIAKIIRYQSRPDICTAPSPSSNKCACVRRQSYS